MLGSAMTDATARATMLIRRPVNEVFNAFVDPSTLTKFWLEASSGPLAAGARVTWNFMVPGATEVVTVTAFERPEHIEFAWSDGVQVKLHFEARVGETTRVEVRVSGFAQKNQLEQAINATEGFSIVLCDLKTLLETGRSANLVRDKAELITQQAQNA